MFTNDTDKLDQHFLIDKKVIDNVIQEANLKSDDIVVEIGPGKGVVTKLIAPKVKKLILIEKDKRLNTYLSDIKKEYNNVEIIYDSVLKAYIPDCNKIITSLPYSIIEPFISKIIKVNFNSCLMITGETFAKNVTEQNLNRLSLLTNSYFKTNYLMDIDKSSFNPEPRVTSSLIKIEKLELNSITNYKKLIYRNMFHYKNKKIYNSLVESLIDTEKRFDKTLTQKESKKIVSIYLSDDLKDKLFLTISNSDLEKLDNNIEEIIDAIR